MRLDHFVLNVERRYQTDSGVIGTIENAGFPYRPKWGKGTRGFKASNLWIGNEYLEMIHILKANGGGWKADWVEHYQKGNRGLVCLMLDVEDIVGLHSEMEKAGVEVSVPATLEFKWFFNLFTRKMPWRNAYFNFFEGVPLQIGLQQMDSVEAYQFMEQYMVPNSRDNKIVGIEEVQIEGKFTQGDFQMIQRIFKCEDVQNGQMVTVLSSKQRIIFKQASEYAVTMHATSAGSDYSGKEIQIENCKIVNLKLSS